MNRGSLVALLLLLPSVLHTLLLFVQLTPLLFVLLTALPFSQPTIPHSLLPTLLHITLHIAQATRVLSATKVLPHPSLLAALLSAQVPIHPHEEEESERTRSPLWGCLFRYYRKSTCFDYFSLMR